MTLGRLCGVPVFLTHGLHLVLPIPLAYDVLVKGWAVAHPLAGIRRSAGMVMIFRLRDVAELDIVTAIVRASYYFALGDRGVPH